MATTQVGIYNLALSFLGERSASTITDATEPVRVIHGLWDHASKFCLEQGHWKFAERESVLTPSLTEVPTTGLANAFAKPSDYVRLNALCSDEFFRVPIIHVHERGLFWYCDLDTVYLRYVSNDTAYGMDITLWPETFVLYTALYLAILAVPRIAPERKGEVITAPGNVGIIEAKRNALAKDAVAGPIQFVQQGNWASSRSRNGNGRNSRSSLYGS